jgi:hypothetical protein
MNQERLNGLWLACGGTEIEELRIRPFIDIAGLAVTAVHRSDILQTMLIDNWLGAKREISCSPTSEVYIRQRETACSEWGDWLSCSGEASG